MDRRSFLIGSLSAISFPASSLAFLPPTYDLVWEDHFEHLCFRTGGPSNNGYIRGKGTWTLGGNSYRAGKSLGIYTPNNLVADPFSRDFQGADLFDLYEIGDSILTLRARNIPTELKSITDNNAPKHRPPPSIFGSMITASDGFQIKLPFYREARLRISRSAEAWPASYSFGLNRKDFPRDLSKKEFEIDDLETFGDSLGMHSAVHWHDTERTPREYHVRGNRYVPGFDLAAAFHNYGVWLTETHTKFYFDGVEVFALPHPIGADPFQPMSHIFQMISQKNSYHLAAPVSLEIDYLRYFAPNSNESIVKPGTSVSAKSDWILGERTGEVPFSLAAGTQIAKLSGAATYEIWPKSQALYVDGDKLMRGVGILPPRIYVVSTTNQGVKSLNKPIALKML